MTYRFTNGGKASPGLLIILLALMAACVPVASNPLGDMPQNTPAAESDSLPVMATTPTQPAPVWAESGAAITLENVPQIRLLGRLDSAGDPSTIFDHALSPDGTRLAGLDNTQLAVWDLITGERVFSTSRREATRVFFSADKAEVYLLELSGLVTAHDALNGQTRTSFNVISDYEGITAYYAEDGWLAVGNREGQVRVWDPLERTSVVTFSAHDTAVRHMLFSPDGEWLVTADHTTIKVWDWRERSLITTFTNETPVQALSLNQAKTILAVGSSEFIYLWSLPDGTFDRLLDSGPGAVQVMAFSPDDRYLVHGGIAPELLIWQPETGQLVARLPESGAERVSMSFAPDGSLLLTSALNGPVTLWNLTTITDHTVNQAQLDVGQNYVYAVNWTSDSRLLTLFGMYGSVYIWGIPTQQVSQ